jgi:hypothetical protein
VATKSLAPVVRVVAAGRCWSRALHRRIFCGLPNITARCLAAFVSTSRFDFCKSRNMKTTSHSTNSVKRSLLRDLFLRISLLLICFGLPSTTKAVNPPPDGAYPGANTAEGGAGALFSLTSGTNNTALGSQALYNVRNGSQNTATGAQALKDNNASQNTADGFQALTRNNGGQNTATGWRALFSNTGGSSNTADGYGALYNNIAGSQNTAGGYYALYANHTGNRNTAYGYQAIFSAGGSDNTAVGFSALESGSGASNNTAVGSQALIANTTGSSNTATGFDALSAFMTGSNNTANGFFALGGQKDPEGPPDGSNNTAMGANALSGGRYKLDNNTAVGVEALQLHAGGHDNIAIGYQAGANLGNDPFEHDNNIEIGNVGDLEDQSTIRIGDVQMSTFIAGIRGVTTGNGDAIPVVIDSAGQLGTMSSSKRFKQAIRPMNTASAAILALKPVIFHYKSDKTDRPQFGLIAEEVAEVNPDLVVRDSNGEIYTVRYDAINAMLLNEFLKEHKKVENLETIVAQLAGRVKEQDSKIEQISNELDQSKAAPEVVANR